MKEEKKKGKKFSLPIMLLIMVVCLAGYVMAGTCTYTQPGASAVLSGASNYINITATGVIKNCTVTAASALSSGSFTVGTFSNYSNVSVNGTFSTAAQRDASDWVFSATCINSTGATIDTCTRTGLIIDNTVPVVSGCTINGVSAANGTQGQSDNALACTVKNATTCSAYWKTSTALVFTTGTASRSNVILSAFTASTTYGASGLTATANLKDAEDNAMNAYIACSDGRNTTTGTTYAISMEGTSKAQKQYKVNLQTGSTTYVGQKKDTGIMFLIMIAIAAVFLIITFFVIQKKKK